MAAISLRASATGDLASPGATTNVTLPAGTVATDIVVAVFNSNRAALISPNVITPPAGWTAIHSSYTDNNGLVEATIHAFWALGSVASLAFSNSQTVTLTQGWVTASFINVDNTNPIDATSAGSSGTGGAGLTINSVNVVTNGAWLMMVAGDTDHQDIHGFGAFSSINNGNPPTNSSANLIYNTTPYAPGPTGTTVVNIVVSDPGDILIGMPFALKPLADVSVNATGQSSTVARGLVVASTAVASTGQASTTASGSATGTAGVGAIGQSVMAGHGQPSAGADVVVDVTGQSLATSQGTVTAGMGPPMPGVGNQPYFVVTYISTNQSGW